MSKKIKRPLSIVCAIFLCFIILSCNPQKDSNSKGKRIIVTSDTLLASIVSCLLPEEKYTVYAILPSDQCPGHYDVKLKDIERINVSHLIIYFKGMPFLNEAVFKDKTRFYVDTKGHNWMSPDYYEQGVNMLSVMLAKHFKEDAPVIERLRDEEIKRLKKTADYLKKLIIESGLTGKKVIASSMQKEPLEWMGFNVIAEYGRQESLSTKDILRLTKTGKKEGAKLVVDNLQSGPDTGRSIAEAIGVPHVVITNFPSEEGYLITLQKNVFTVINALVKK